MMSSHDSTADTERFGKRKQRNPSGQNSRISRMRSIVSVRDLTLLAAWIILVLTFSQLSPHFWSLANARNIGQAVAVIGITAVGATLVLVSGGIDLTVGSVIGFSGVLVGALLTGKLQLGHITSLTGDELAGQMAIPLAVALVLLAGAALGAFNATLIVNGRINPLIATLGMMSVIRGFAYVYSDGVSHGIVSESFEFLGRGRLAFGIPVPIVTMLLIYGLVWFVMRYTNLGNYVYAIGDNAQASRLAGVNVKLWRYVVYILGGIFASLAGLISASMMGAALPRAGMGYELNVIAAVILGGASLKGGIGNVVGTLLGVLIMGTLNNGFTLLNIPAFYQMIAQGLVLIMAVFIDQVRTGGYE